MDHKVVNVQELYEDASKLYTDVVLGKADTIIDDLGKAIENLKTNWEGKDAGVQINNVVDVYNAMTKIRNVLATLAKDSSFVASKYREIQNANRAGYEELQAINIAGEKAAKEAYSDDRDTININSNAMNGKTLLDTVTTMYDEFKTETEHYHDTIMSNWQEGTGRNNAETAFEEFKDNADKYKEILAEVSNSIADALKNYQM